MVHSIELLFDDATEAAIRRDWAALTDAGLPSQGRVEAPSNRPHVTLAVAARIDPAVDEVLRGSVVRLPIACRVGAPLLLGRKTLTLARLVVPSPDLLELHAGVFAAAGPFLTPGPLPHSRPGEWTPHTTLCRRLPPADLAAALAVLGPADITGAVAGLRRWNGDARTELLLRG